jgi:hypothetical protein
LSLPIVTTGPTNSIFGNLLIVVLKIIVIISLWILIISFITSGADREKDGSISDIIFV